MEIFIPSSGRPFRQVTFRNLPKSLQERTHIVVPPDEVKDYKDFPTITHERVVRDISKVRQWILEQAKHKFIMLDDDLVFAVRREDDPTKFRNPQEEDILDLFKEIEQLLSDYVHVGVATREGGNRDPEDYKYNTRMIRILAYDALTVKNYGLNFRVRGREDLDMTLQLLRSGLPNIVINHMVSNQGSSNSDGGCSQWRTDQVLTETAHELAALHPDYVKVVRKTTKTAWGGGTRTDVVIQWKKAYNDAA